MARGSAQLSMVSGNTKATSIQADPAVQRRIKRAKGKGRSHVQALNDETKRNAYNHMLPWQDDDVETLINMRDANSTIFDMAMSLGRSYYATQYASAHVGFAMRHAAVFKRAL